MFGKSRDGTSVHLCVKLQSTVLCGKPPNQSDEHNSTRDGHELSNDECNQWEPHQDKRNVPNPEKQSREKSSGTFNQRLEVRRDFRNVTKFNIMTRNTATSMTCKSKKHLAF